jgi:hypothetical protein
MKLIVIRVLVAGTLLCIGTARAQIEYVDPAMGGQGFMLEPTRPTVSLPNSMVRVYPVRKDHLDDQIQSFPLTIISHRLGELFWLMPGDGSSDRWNQPAVYDQEVETPYYYSTRFDDSLIQTEFHPLHTAVISGLLFPPANPWCCWRTGRAALLPATAKAFPAVKPSSVKVT